MKSALVNWLSRKLQGLTPPLRAVDTGQLPPAAIPQGALLTARGNPAPSIPIRDESAPSSRRPLPRPALRWVGERGLVALREFDFTVDASDVCAFQEETYTLNFPDFKFTASFADAFRHDLRRATLDSQHGLYVLDDGRVIGFLWLVICQNTWTNERYGYVNNIYVAPWRRGQGLSSELMQQGESFFRSRSVHRIRLTVTAENEVACGLYRKSGFITSRWEMEKDI